MSEPRLLPPPLPPLAALAQPIPVQPLAELAHEDHYQPDDYRSYRPRPGIITAISILSITIGSLGLITGGLSALYGGIFFFVAKQATTMQRTAAIASQQAVLSPALANNGSLDPNIPPNVLDRGLDVPTRQIIIEALAAQRPLNESRRRQLHALLAKAGQDIFVTSRAAANAGDVRRAVSESGQLSNASDADASKGPDYFVIATGRIEVSDDWAVFEPSDRSEDETVRVRAPRPENKAAGISASGMPMQDVLHAADLADRLSGNRVTPQQHRALIAEFASRTDLLQPRPGWPVESQVTAASILDDGSVLVLTRYGQVQITSSGMVGRGYINGIPPRQSAPFGIRTTNGRSPIAGAAVVLVVGEGVLSVLLSIYLLVIGIFMLRQSPSGRRLHIIYAVVKIPLAVICGIGWCWIIGGFFSSVHAAGGGSSIAPARAVVLAMTTLVALLYPIGLLITFATPPVKRYYDSASTGE